MEAIKMVLVYSNIVWIIVDRFKKLWEKSDNANIINTLVAFALSFLFCIGFNLDITSLLSVHAVSPIIGYLASAVCITGGSSITHELIDLKNDSNNSTEVYENES